MYKRWTLVAFALALPALSNCKRGMKDDAYTETPTSTKPFTLSLVGTNDVHGYLDSLPIFAGYLGNLRADTGHEVLLVDGGDMWQGTLASNLSEGAAMVRAYNALGYDAVALGNHEFDYGPLGPRSTPKDADDDALGALKARAKEATFPILSANVRHIKGGPLPGIDDTAIIEKRGVKIGLIGLSTELTLMTTHRANTHDVAVDPLAPRALAAAKALREKGASIIIVTAHAGGKCHAVDDSHDLSSCDQREEIFRLARALPKNGVDAIVAGHTHQGVAHYVNGIPIIESYAYGKAFGRIDFEVVAGSVVKSEILKPVNLATGSSYHGQKVFSDKTIANIVSEASKVAQKAEAQTLAVHLDQKFRRRRDSESPLGNLITDWMLAAHNAHARKNARADVAILNAGGIRRDLPKGSLRYGDLFQTFPFDNMFASATVSVADLTTLLAENLISDEATLLTSGITIEANCKGGVLSVGLLRSGKPLSPSARLTLLTSDYLSTGKFKNVWKKRDRKITFVTGDNIRDAIANWLKKHPQGHIKPTSYFDKRMLRFRLGKKRPLRCRNPR